MSCTVYNGAVQKQYDFIVIGAGIIGLALTWELSRRSARVLLIERREPGQEASHAGGGMIADLDPVLPAELLELAHRSAKLYPTFASELAAESEHAIDLRDVGVIAFEQHPIAESDGIRALTSKEALSLEPNLALPPDPAYAMRERAVDPRDLVSALLSALHKRGVQIVSGESVLKILVERSSTSGVVTDRASYAAPCVVNCAGAWASQIAGANLPTLPVKGHMVALAFPEELAMSPATREEKRVLRHVLRSRWCYIIPRSNGRYVVGSTVEPAGFDKSLNTYRVKQLQNAAARLIPQFAEAKIAEAWTGLRPGTPDNLPLLGATGTSGYFAATGHYRDGILLTPVTAEVMCALLLDGKTPVPLDRFSPRRFE
jgi:glycine oxidase